MYSELIVMIGAGQEDSDRVLRTLESRGGGELLTMSDIALIRRDNQGKSAFQMRWQESDHSINRHNRLAGAFAEAIFGFSRAEKCRRLTEAGLDPLFIQEVDRALKPKGSAYLIYVPWESRIDTRLYLEILELLPGKLYHTTFRHEVEEVFLEAN